MDCPICHCVESGEHIGSLGTRQHYRCGACGLGWSVGCIPLAAPKVDEPLLVLIRIREVYGKRVAYPANQKADLLASLSGVKTLNRRRIELIRDLGFTVKAINDTSIWPDE